MITQRSLDAPIPSIFSKFVEILKTYERDKKEFHIILLTNKVAMTNDLFWKMRAVFENKDEYQDRTTCLPESDIKIYSYWLPQFHIKGINSKKESIADAMAGLDEETDDYLTSGMALIDNTSDLMDNDDIDNIQECFYALIDFNKDKYHVVSYIDIKGKLAFGVYRYNGKKKRLTNNILSMDMFVEEGRYSELDLILKAQQLAQWKQRQILKFDSLQTRMFVRDYIVC
jgi:hypothetical protein